MKSITRRNFVKTTGLAGAAVLSAPALNVLGANEEIRVAVMGVKSQGFSNAKTLRKIEGVKVVALCDPDREILAKRVKEFGEVEGYIDYRKALDREDIDAVCIATPNHWHSLMAIQACQAGKDVYVQKPVSHNIWEGLQLEKARVKYNRIVQAGTQNRSDVGLRPFYQDAADGKWGKLKMAIGQCYRNRSGIGKVDTPLKPPESVDYNLWLGPAEDLPMYRKQFHYDWHWIFNTGNGDIGNQGPHETDLLYWALGNESLPTRVISFGGRFAWKDGGETPNLQYAGYEWNGIPVIFEVADLAVKPDARIWPANHGIRTGVILVYEGGTFIGGRGGGKVYDENKKMLQHYKGDGGGGHFKNFIQAVRSRKQDALHAPVGPSARSASVAHMANISYLLGSEVGPDKLRECMQDDKEGMDAAERFGEQLANWNHDFKKEPWTLGVSLKFDSDKCRFTGRSPLVKKANKMVTREYRKPFVVPEKV